MPRKRLPENRGLPSRWRFQRGAYYYQVPPGLEDKWDGKKSFKLGKKLVDAYGEWTRRIQYLDTANTIGQLLDRYALEIIPTKAAATQTGNHRQLKKLRPVFGDMPIYALQPRHVYAYIDKRKAPVQSRREIALLSHAYTMAVKWGYIDRHPFKGQLELDGEEPRDRYVEDWEIAECLSLDSRRKKGSIMAIKAYIKLKLLTGLDQSDLLRIQETDIQDDGLHNSRHKTQQKTGRKTIYEWSDALRAAVSEARDAKPFKTSPFLFCNGEGEGYYDERTGTASGWDSMWQRFMTRALDETKLKERFTSHDLRAKAASDVESLDHAARLLAHADSKITKRVYRRKPEIVKPTK